MRSTNELLGYLRGLDIQLWVDQGRLRFNAPQDVMTPELKAEIASHKAEIIELLSRVSPASAPITIVDRQQNLELSFTQRRLWFLYQIDRDVAAYQLRYNLQMTGVLHVDILERSLTEIVRRHEILRTNFVEKEGNPFQIIHPPQPVQLSVIDLQLLRRGEASPQQKPQPVILTVIDLQGFASEEREIELHRLANQEAEIPFNLEKDALLRVTLLRLEPQKHILLIKLHHIIADAWSIGVFSRELTSLYKSFTEAKPANLPDLPIQYADFSQWQNQYLTKETLVDQLAYWKDQLAGIPPVSGLPTDRPRPPVQTFKGGAELFEVSKALTEKLKNLSQKSGGTLFMTIMSAFFILLARHTGEADIVVGIPIANRTRLELESLMGCFVNTLVLRSQLHGNPTFLDLLQKVRQTALNAYANQDLPFEQLVEALQPERSLSHNPLCQVLFAWENVQMNVLEFPNLQVTPFKTGHSTARTDLCLEMMETGQGLQGSFEYSTDLFDVETIRRMIDHFQILLAEIVANPEQTVMTLPLLTAGEKQQVLEAWNATTTTYPQEKSIAAIFEEQVKLRGNAIAAKFGETEISYAELNTKANHLAHYLQNKGIGDQALVGICVDQSVEMLIGLLGILKAGAAYVPLDKDYPDDRLELMLNDAGVRVVITQQQQAARFANHGHEIICLDREWTEISKTPNSLNNPRNQATGNSLAYVIYTSGSTGHPKGVEVEQRAIARLVINTNYINIGHEDRIGQASNASFDAATFEIWGALLNGAMVVGINKETVLTPESLAATILEQHITTLFLTTALFNQIARQKPETFAPLKNLLFGGEAVDVEAVRIIMAKGKPARLLHVYGPTENTTFSTWYLINQIAPKAISIPIGQAIANTQTYILDRQQQIVPIGVIGELHVGGDGLAKGYLHRPELNTEKFIPNPYLSSERLYRTGDLAKYDANGDIEFMGRIDFQVKIRGFRIEIGEVEAAIAHHDRVQDLIVIAKDDPLGNKSLIAYVVAKPETELTTNQLRSFLKENLPDYMIPAAFVVMDKLPLTANGKVDKKALPSPEEMRSQIADDYVMPQTDAERLIASVWQEVLQINNVGIYDNFFEIGGNSLLLVQAYSKLQNLFGSQVSIVVLFRYPNIHALAEHLSQSQPTEVSDPNRAENRKSRQDLMKQQRQNRLKSRLPNNSHDL
jgi:amino acid adenylation domain-containing protein